MNKTVILTGLRANNNLTLGNYLGAMLPIIKLAQNRDDKYQINMFIPDLHSITTPTDYSQLSSQVTETARYFIASGLPTNSDNIIMYRQSYVPAHSELTWILDCFTGMGELSRMTQFKDKSSLNSEDRVSVGLFNYPVLMAADILLYNAKYIPVGEDQTQHLEFTRDIAERLNTKFGNICTVPVDVKSQRAFFSQEMNSLRIKDLIEPTKKMSKSDKTSRGVIFLTDTPEDITKKIMSATTDSLGAINYDPENQPGISNLLNILSAITDTEISEIENRYKGKTNYGDLKKDVASAVSELTSKVQSKANNISDNEVMDFIKKSETKANDIANESLYKFQLAVGLRSKDQ